MKKIITFCAAIFMTAIVFAQAPEKMSYQAVVRDGNNNLVSSAAVGMQISIVQGSASGTAVYVETQTPTSNANGLVSIEIGDGTVVSGDFTTIDWANGPYFIKTETDPTGGANYTITGTSQLLSVPYALHAKTAETIKGTITETDPIFGASVASGITGTDTANWNNKLDSYTETDPIFGASVASGITGTDTTNWNNKLDSYTETDPIFGASVASGITGTDTTNWNNKLDSYTETDPIFGASVASGITGTDTTNWNNKLDSYTETDPIFGASVASGITGTDTTNWNNKQDQLTVGTNITIVGNTISATVPTNVSAFTNDAGYVTTLNDDDPTNEIQQLSVSATGDTLHLQNGGFVIIPGLSAANAPTPTYPGGTVHCTGTPTAVVDVTNPSTGKIWMDRNLGASQAATSSTDANAYGDLYQWGRGADGHQCRNSATTTTLSSTDQPTHGGFITVNSGNIDWRNPQNTNLWQGVNGVNNPCPSGYRLPTETELNAERLSWSSNNSVGAFASPLKLPVAGNRGSSNGSLNNVGTYVRYWSSTVSSTNSRNLYFGSSAAVMSTGNRANGLSVRCLKDTPPPSGAIGALDCNVATTTGTLVANTAASGVSSSIPYTGGNGGTHSGQIVSSLGVTGLTATLAAGNFANGAGSLTYSITGTPSSNGTASFPLNMGGQTCTLAITVNNPYSGTWTGVYSGTDNGTFIFVVDSSGNINGTFTSNVFGVSIPGTGAVDQIGNFNGATTNGTNFSGLMNLSGIATGTWSNSQIGSGTINGTKSP